MSENDLIEQPRSKGDGWVVGGESTTNGAGPIDSASKTVDAFGSGDWAEGLAQGAGTALDGVAGLADPLAMLASAGVGWAMEHVSFLREPLDWLAGDPPAIDAMSQTWQNIGQEIDDGSQQFQHAVKQATGDWAGPAGEAYRATADQQKQLHAAVGAACSSMAAGVKTIGTVISVVRGIVRDMIAQAVGEILAAIAEWAVAGFISAGLAAPAAIGDIVRRATKWAGKISEWVSKIVSVFKKAWNALEEFGHGIGQLATGMRKAATTTKDMAAKTTDMTGLHRGKLDAPGVGFQGRGSLDESAAVGKFSAPTPFGTRQEFGWHVNPSNDAAKLGWEGVKKTTELDNAPPDETGQHDGTKRPENKPTGWSGTL
ncbi:WXG100 family type VII secretion target [Salinifilum ghardaiensis]